MREMTLQQMTARDKLIKWRVGALFMEAGTGKTRVAVELARDCGGVDLVLWIGPLRTIRSEMSSVVDEVGKWGGFGCGVVYYGVESISASDRIYNEIISVIEQHKGVFVIVDESLKIKNAEAKRTKRLLELSKMPQVQYKLILNGTPLSKNLMDLWSQMEFLSPKILSMSLAQFKNTFCNYVVMERVTGRCRRRSEVITGYENIDYLCSLIGEYVYECDLHLRISQNYHSVDYYLSDEEEEVYYKLKEEWLSLENLDKYNDNIFLAMTQQMQHSYCCSESKMQAVERLFNKELKEEETIIFCKYIDSRQACEKRFPKAKVLSYQKESFGLNLQEYHNTIYFDKVWDLALRTQSSRRTYRTGQEYDCSYWDLTGNVGLEGLIDKCIHNKVSMVEYFKTKGKQAIEEL